MDWRPGKRAQQRVKSTSLEVEPQGELQVRELRPAASEFVASPDAHARGAVEDPPSSPAKFKRGFRGVSSVHEEVLRFPLCTLAMSAPELPRLPESVSYTA